MSDSPVRNVTAAKRSFIEAILLVSFFSDKISLPPDSIVHIGSRKSSAPSGSRNAIQPFQSKIESKEGDRDVPNPKIL